MTSFLGIARERVYSPGKVDADREILESVAALLRADHEVDVIGADDPLPETSSGAVVFSMAQSPAALQRLREWAKAGIRVVNTPDAVEGCHRRNMILALAQAGVRQPESVLVSTTDTCDAVNVQDGIWVKRGDVHATQEGDVVYVSSREKLHAVLREFARRGISHAALQRHVDGPVFKFYAVRGVYFSWFCDLGAKLEANEIVRMHRLAESAAEALGLEVYGGDCVRERSGDLLLIDVNDWPSYERCRLPAATAIAAYLCHVVP